MNTQTQKTAKTLNDFFTNYSSNPELHKKAWKAGNVDWNDFKANPNDYYAANTGAVSGMIYYTHTVKFAKANLELIHEAVRNFEEETGSPCTNMPKFSEDETQYYNWLAWFAWESMAEELINYLGD